MDIFGVREKKDVLGVNVYQNPNVPEDVKERMQYEESLDFGMNYPFSGIEGYYDSKKKGYIALYSKVSRLCDGAGNFLGHIFLNIDNTERLDAINKIQDFENFFLLISDYAKVGYAKLNLLDRQGYAIKQWFKNMGEEEDTPLSDVVGVYGKMHPDDRKEVLDFYQEVQTGRIGSFRKEVRIHKTKSEMAETEMGMYYRNGTGCG